MIPHRAPLLVVTGTGTEIGKTHVACALLRAWGRRRNVAGYKPIETGVGDGPTDQERLRSASTFHVKQGSQVYEAPLSPHLAARHAGRPIDIEAAVRAVEELRGQAPGVVVELAGGLFTPLAADAANVDLARRLGPTAVLLVAPDRLGVLHDVISTVRAAAAAGVAISGILLSETASSDASTGTNAEELRLFVNIPVWGVLHRGSDSDAAVAVAEMWQQHLEDIWQ